MDQDQPSSKASSASALESTNNYLQSANKKQKSDEYDEEQIEDTVFEQEQLEDEDIMEDLDEDERIIEDEEEDLDLEEDYDLEFEEEKLPNDFEAKKDKTKNEDLEMKTKSTQKTRDRLFSDDFEFECDLTDSERSMMKQKMNEKNQPIQNASKKPTEKSRQKKRKTSQSSDENLLSPYRRQSIGHSPTNRTIMRPQLINTKKQKKFKNRLNVDTHRRRFSDVFFANAPPISQPVSQPSSRLSNISDQAVTGSLSVSSISRPSSTPKLDVTSRPQSAIEKFKLPNVQQKSEPNLEQKEEFKSTSIDKQLLDNIFKESLTTSPIHYARNRSPSCAVVPSHYIKQSHVHRESIAPIADIKEQNKRRGMSLSFTPSGARQLTNQVTRKLSKQLLKLNQSTKNLLGKSSPKPSPKSREHTVSMESSKDITHDLSEFYSSIETPPSSSIIGANILIYPMVNSPAQATLNQASLAAFANLKSDQQFAFDNVKIKERDQIINKEGHVFMNQMKKARNVFRSFIPLQLNADTFTSNLFDLKECLPANYYSMKGIDKNIKVRSKKR